MFVVAVKMLSAHICDQTCIEKRKLRTQIIIKCIICDKDFNAKCFDISFPTSKSYFTLNSHVVFICLKCHNSKNKHTTTTISAGRKSITQTNDKSTVASNSPYSQQSSKTDELLKRSHDHTSLLNQILSRINETTDANKTQPQQQQVSTNNVCNCDNNNKTNEAIKHLNRTIDALSNKIGELSSTYFDRILDSVTNIRLSSELYGSNRLLSMDNINNSLLNKVHNWDVSASSMSANANSNHSLMEMQNEIENRNKHNEIFEIYRRFE